VPQTPHVERHFSGSEIVRDIVIGMSDGLTVPFALAAGLSGIANSTAIVITGGLAEIAAGSIAMGLRLPGGQERCGALRQRTRDRATRGEHVKGRFTGARPIRSAIQTALIGGLAAAVAFGLAKAISK